MARVKTVILALASIAAVAAGGGCTVVHAPRGLEPEIAIDTPSIWVEIMTSDDSDDSYNGMCRCTDNGKQPVYRKATICRRTSDSNRGYASRAAVPSLT